MKKIFLYAMLALGAGLSACTTKDLDWESPNGNSGTVEVEIPEGGTPTDGTDAPFPETPEGYQLRCILVSGENRYEMVESESVNNKFYFTDVPEDAEVFVWADFIEEDAVSDENGRYADLYYDTQQIPAISYVADRMTDGSLFNNDACDAFYGHVAAGEGTVLTLKRPFAKVTYSNEDAIVVSGNVAVSYDVFNRFDIQGGTPDGTGTISYIGGVADRANRVWFSNYLFASASGNTVLPGTTISMTADGVTKNIGISHMMLGADKTVNAHFNWADAGISITVDAGFSDPDAPRVGDYYYSDGTWSTVLDDCKTVVGVVFAIATDGAENDTPENYESLDFENIKGWVVALNDNASGTNTAPRFISDASGGSTARLVSAEGVGTGVSDIKGYANCLAWLENELMDGAVYTALSRVATHADDNNAPLPDDVVTSGWYIGSLGQMMELREKYTAESSKVKASLQALADAGKATMLREGTGGVNYYYTSTTGSSSSVSVGVYCMSTSAEVTATPYSVGSGADGRAVRPILTF